MEKSAVDFFKEELEKELEFKAVEKFWYGLYQQAKEIDKEQKIKAQIEILRTIGNNGPNAPLYGILKTTLIELEQQLKSE